MRSPDLTTRGASAWKLELPGEHKLTTDELLVPADARWLTTIGGWLVYQARFSPVYRWWLMTIVHLRDVPGLPPSTRRYPEAAYEFILCAVDAEAHKGVVDADKARDGFHVLEPPAQSLQFHGLTDAKAADLLKHAATLFTIGTVNPDAHGWGPLIRKYIDRQGGRSNDD